MNKKLSLAGIASIATLFLYPAASSANYVNTYIANGVEWNLAADMVTGTLYDNPLNWPDNVSVRFNDPANHAFDGCVIYYNMTLTGYSYTGNGGNRDVEIPASIGWDSHGSDGVEYGPLQFIASSAFSGKNATSVKIPSTILGIDLPCFRNCPDLVSIEVDELNKYYSSEDGVLYNKDKTKLIKYPDGKTDPVFAVPDTVADLGIGGQGFQNLGHIVSFEVGPGNSSYSSEDGVLYNKDKTQLIKYPEGKEARFFVVPATVTDLAPHCFANTKLVAVQFQGDRPNSASTTFSGSECVVYYPKGRASWSEESDEDAGWGEPWNGVRLYPIPVGGTEVIQDPAFDEGTTYHYEIVDGIVWVFVVTNGAASLECKPTQDGGWGGEASIPWGIRGTVVIPSSLGGCPVRRIGAEALCYGSYSNVVIPDSVHEIAVDAFCYNGDALTSIAIPHSVTNIEAFAFECSSGLTNIFVENGNPAYASANGVLYNKEMTVLVEAPPGMEGVFSIPDGVTNVMAGAFCSCDGLTSILIPDSVWSIGRDAFYWCNDALFDTNSIPGAQLVDGWVFAGSTYTWDSVEVSGDVDLTGIRGIVDGAFRYCQKLTSVQIPGNVERIGASTFSDCTGLTNVVIGIGVTEIGESAFSYCDGLESVTIPDSVAVVGDAAFYGCDALKTLSVPGVWYGTGMLDGACVSEGCTVRYRGVPTYKVKFAKNGGTGTMSDQTIRRDVSTALSANTFKRTGYTFLGWAKSAGGAVVYSDKAKVKNLAAANGMATLYAKWAKTKYSVAFNANGGKGTMAKQTMTYGKSAKLRKNAFKRLGYTFLGWAKTKAGAVAYPNAASVKNLRTDGKTTTLYAKWAKQEYTVAFKANGGTGTMTKQTMTYGKSAKLRKNAFERKGYTFAGWTTTKTGEVVYKDASSVKNLRTDGKTTTLYAKWAKTSYTVAFNANGGKGTMAKQTMTYGKSAKLKKNAFKRAGYTFAGWATTKKGAVAYQNAAAVKNLRTDGKTTTLYAVWTKARAAAKSAKPGEKEAGEFLQSDGEETVAEKKSQGAAGGVGDSGRVVVTASGGENADAVADGDGETAWTADASEGAWVVLSFAEALDVGDVEVAGENLPDGIRFLLSEDAEEWREEIPGRARYVWVAFPESDNPLSVKEIRVLPE